MASSGQPLCQGPADPCPAAAGPGLPAGQRAGALGGRAAGEGSWEPAQLWQAGLGASWEDPAKSPRHHRWECLSSSWIFISAWAAKQGKARLSCLLPSSSSVAVVPAELGAGCSFQCWRALPWAKPASAWFQDSGSPESLCRFGSLKEFCIGVLCSFFVPPVTLHSLSPFFALTFSSAL